MIARTVALAAVLLVALLSILVVTVEPLRWRAEVVWRFAGGEITDVKLGELLRMLRPGSGFWLVGVLEGNGLMAVVDNPFESKPDVEAGATLYRQHCSGCHGVDASGGSGPSLQQRAQLKHGSSDWALYRNITDGVAGTVMPATLTLSFEQTWRVIAFVRSLGTDDAAAAISPGKLAGAKLLAKYADVTYRKLLEAGNDDGEWRMYSRTYDGRRFSPLQQINTANVGKLRLRWIRQLATAESIVEAAPIVVNGVMFITEPPNNVLALDASSGTILWSYRRAFTEHLSLCCGKINRGVAVLDDKVYLATLDAHLVALDAKTGKVVWDVQLAKPSEGYSITGAPLAVRDMIVTGVAGGEFGIRGFLQALDARTGEMRWRFHTIPGPGEPGHESWSTDAWKTGGGPTWVTGSFDPDLNLIYWGVGNPSPNFDGDMRSGDNLYTNSVIAVDAASGRLAWHFQFTPHDEHDWDSNQVPVLASIRLNGVETRVIAWANRNGFYYVLDRRSGRFIAGVPFARQNWATGLDKSGRPTLNPEARVSTGGTLTYPSVSGATNWQSPAFSSTLGLFFVHADEGSSIFSKAHRDDVKRRPYEQYLASGTRKRDGRHTFVRALKVATGERAWQYESMNNEGNWWSGLLATAGGLVFGAAGERAFALDAASGAELWRVRLGGEIYQGPVTYADAGQQIVIFIAGRVVAAFSLP
jgi:alcohol dehydrogenase (cytochrome c)